LTALGKRKGNYVTPAKQEILFFQLLYSMFRNSNFIADGRLGALHVPRQLRTGHLPTETISNTTTTN